MIPEALKVLSSHENPCILYSKYDNYDKNLHFTLSDKGVINEFNLVDNRLCFVNNLNRPNEEFLKNNYHNLNNNNKIDYYYRIKKAIHISAQNCNLFLSNIPSNKELNKNDFNIDNNKYTSLDPNCLVFAYDDGLILVWRVSINHINELDNKDEYHRIKNLIKSNKFNRNNENINSYNVNPMYNRLKKTVLTKNNNNNNYLQTENSKHAKTENSINSNINNEFNNNSNNNNYKPIEVSNWSKFSSLKNNFNMVNNYNPEAFINDNINNNNNNEFNNNLNLVAEEESNIDKSKDIYNDQSIDDSYSNYKDEKTLNNIESANQLYIDKSDNCSNNYKDLCLYQDNIDFFNSYELDLVLIGHQSCINNIKYINGTEFLISADNHNVIKLWNLSKGYSLYTINTDVVTSYIFSYNIPSKNEYFIKTFTKDKYYIDFNLNKDPIVVSFKSGTYYNIVRGISNIEVICMVKIEDPKKKSNKNNNNNITYKKTSYQITILINSNNDFIILNEKNNMNILKNISFPCLTNNKHNHNEIEKSILYISQYKNDIFVIICNDNKMYFINLDIDNNQISILFNNQVCEDLVTEAYVNNYTKKITNDYTIVSIKNKLNNDKSNKKSNKEIKTNNTKSSTLNANNTALYNRASMCNFNKINNIEEVNQKDLIVCSNDNYCYSINLDREYNLYTRRIAMVDEDNISVAMNIEYQKQLDKLKKKRNKSGKKKRPASKK